MNGDAVYVERGMVVPDRRAALALTGDGIPATTFGDVLGQPDEMVRGYFGREPAILVGPRRGIVADVARRLRGLGIRVRIVGRG